MGPRRRRVVWTEGARRELDAAIAFVADESLDGAIRLLEDILNSADSLHSMPDRGRVVPERDDPIIRELLVGPYRLLYHATESDVAIVAVLHQRPALHPATRSHTPTVAQRF